MISEEKLVVILIFALLLVRCFLPSGLFQDFFIFDFLSLEYVMPRCSFFVCLFYFIFYLFIYLFIFAVRGPLTAVASPVAEHRLRTRRPSGHGSRAQPLRGTRDPPRPGHEPASPASAGGLPTTAPPGKPP